ncbi:hypothetical protein QTV49_004201 [Vibrio vulnificus]|nr:hypothetical protein [Vibrio vulnificus]
MSDYTTVTTLHLDIDFEKEGINFDELESGVFGTSVHGDPYYLITEDDDEFFFTLKELSLNYSELPVANINHYCSSFLNEFLSPPTDRFLPVYTFDDLSYAASQYELRTGFKSTILFSRRVLAFKIHDFYAYKAEEFDFSEGNLFLAKNIENHLKAPSSKSRDDLDYYNKAVDRFKEFSKVNKNSVVFGFG